jgi:hypothetical protein
MPRRFRLFRLTPTFAMALPVALTLLAACSSSGGDELPIEHLSPPPQPKGWILSSGHVPGQGLLATRLPGGRPKQMNLSIDTVVFDARWIDPGLTAFAFVQPGTDQNEVVLDRIGLGGRPAPVGGVFHHVSATSAADGAFLVATCHGHGAGETNVLGAGDTTWRRVADGCRAALSPDGRSVAFSDDGHTVQTVPVDGGTPTRLLDVDQVDGVRQAGLRDPFVEDMAWGSAGLGMVLHRGKRFAVLVHTDHGDRVGAIAGTPGFVGALRWQPSGPLLAIITFFQGQGSILRSIDARTGRVRVLATDPRGLGGTVWSPDGSLLATLGSRGAWVFVDGNGNRATEVPVDNEFPFDWAT